MKSALRWKNTVLFILIFSGCQAQMSPLQIRQFHQTQQLGLPSIPEPVHTCMLKGRNSIYKTVQGEELDKHQLILCAGKDTGKVLKMAIRVKKLEVVGLVIINAPDHCSPSLSAFVGQGHQI